MKGNIAAALPVVVIGIVMFIGGFNAFSHLDRCADRVMHHGDRCPNTSSRPRNSWINDYDQQKSRNRRVGIAMMAGSAPMFLAGGVLLVYGDLNVRRIVTRRSAARRTNGPRPPGNAPAKPSADPGPPQARGCAWSCTARSRATVTWVYSWVVARLE